MLLRFLRSPASCPTLACRRQAVKCRVKHILLRRNRRFLDVGLSPDFGAVCSGGVPSCERRTPKGLSRGRREAMPQIGTAVPILGRIRLIAGQLCLVPSHYWLEARQLYRNGNHLPYYYRAKHRPISAVIGLIELGTDAAIAYLPFDHWPAIRRWMLQRASRKRSSYGRA